MTTFLPFFYLKQLISFSFNISKQIKTHFVYFNRHYYPNTLITVFSFLFRIKYVTLQSLI